MSEMTLYRVGEWSEEGNGFPIFCDDHDPVHGPLAYFPLVIDAKHVCDKLNLASQPAEQAVGDGVVGRIVGDLCDMEPFDPEHVNAVCVDVDALIHVLERHIPPRPAVATPAEVTK